MVERDAERGGVASPACHVSGGTSSLNAGRCPCYDALVQIGNHHQTPEWIRQRAHAAVNAAQERPGATS